MIGAIGCWHSRNAVHFFRMRMDRVVFVDDVDGLSLDGELDMYGTPTVIGWPCILGRCIPIALFALLRLLSTRKTLGAVSAHIPEPGTVARFCVGNRALFVLETIGMLNGIDD